MHSRNKNKAEAGSVTGSTVLVIQLSFSFSEYFILIIRELFCLDLNYLLLQNFRLQCKEVEKTIAPGLELAAVVEYYNERDENCQDRIIFMIDDSFVEVPLLS